MKISAIILIIITSGFSALVYFQSTLGQPSVAHPTLLQRDSQREPQRADNNPFARLTQENIDLKIKIFKLEEANKKLLAKINTQNISKATDAETPKKDPTKDNVNAEEQAERRHTNQTSAIAFRSFLENMNNVSPSEINKNLSKKFDSEPVDYVWATEYETKLDDIFSTDVELSKFVPEDIQCRTTHCQIKIPISDYAESDQVMESMTKAFSADAHDLKNVMITTIPDMSAGFVDFYISRDANATLYQ